ncbi:hypothetical protein [Zymomonas mobilis]|nr:hypothetical protein [Zymomonas mobilis]UBQ08778.1 hypothetical protein LB319_09710 [Zymomonas mobilis]
MSALAWGLSSTKRFSAAESIKGWTLGALAVFFTVRGFGIDAETGKDPVS